MPSHCGKPSLNEIRRNAEAGLQNFSDFFRAAVQANFMTRTPQAGFWRFNLPSCSQASPGCDESPKFWHLPSWATWRLRPHPSLPGTDNFLPATRNWPWNEQGTTPFANRFYSMPRPNRESCGIVQRENRHGHKNFS